MNKFDIFCTVESKLDKYDIISLDGYTFMHQERRQKYLRKSGGIGVFIKNSLYQHIKLVESSSDYVMWLEVSDANCKKNKPFCLGIVYQPPESSKYYTDDEAEL